MPSPTRDVRPHCTCIPEKCDILMTVINLINLTEMRLPGDPRITAVRISEARARSGLPTLRKAATLCWHCLRLSILSEKQSMLHPPISDCPTRRSPDDWRFRGTKAFKVTHRQSRWFSLDFRCFRESEGPGSFMKSTILTTELRLTLP